MDEQINLHDIKNELEEQQARIRELIENIKDRSQGNNVINPGRDDLAYHYVSAEMQATELTRLEERLTQVEAALDRIDEGQYGICEHCGNPIAPARLRALPYASLCIQCQKGIS